MSIAENKAVFLSYASQDAEAAKRIAEALRAAGVEVWFDQNELVGGDAWDAKIRKQIRECALLIPVISKTTQARREAYFRLEWKLADERTHLMARGTPFLLPVTIDGTNDREALVPDSFLAVQWTRAPGGDLPPAFAVRVQRLLGGEQATSNPWPLSPAAGAPPADKSGRAWLIPGCLALLAAVAMAVWQPWKKAQPDQSTPNPLPTAPASTSEARKLANQAMRLLEDPNFTRETSWLADELCERALKLDSGDAEVWAVAAFASINLHSNTYDPTNARREKARTQAERALQLAPGSVRAGLAVARYERYFGERAEARRRLLALHERAPADQEVLASLIVATERDAEKDKYIAKLRELPRGGALLTTLWFRIVGLRGEARLAEAERIADELLADSTVVRGGYYEKLHLLMRGWHELGAAEPFIEKLPARFRQEPAFGSAIAHYWLWRSDAEKTLRALAEVPQDYFEEYAARETKGLHAGWAHTLAGRATAAQAEWRSALALVEERLRDDSRGFSLLGQRAHLLALTGQKDAAREAWRLRVELGGESNRPAIEPEITYLAASGDNEAAAATLVRAWPSLPKGRVLWVYPQLRYHPAFAKLRDDPRVGKILDETEAWLRELKRESSGAITATKPDDKSVAVLPFANLSGDKEQEYFSDGLTEEILNTLARERDLRVPGRASSFSFKGKSVSSAEIAKALNVSRLVEGSVRKSGNKVRISVSLTRAADGFSEELGTFTEELSDVFALQDKVARVVVGKLTRRTVASASVGLTKNPEAYDAYLRGRSVQTRTPRLMNEAIQHYERAVALDPGFALAWARLAEARFRTFVAQADRSPAVVNGSREAIDRALALQPDLPEALIVRANWVRRVQSDFTGARRDLDRVESLHPVTADLRHAQAQLAQELGQFAEAFRLAREALQLDPQNGDHLNAIGISLCLPRGEFVEADQLIRRAIVVQGSSSATPFVSLVLLRNLWRGPEAALRLTERWPAGQRGRGAARVNLLVRLGRLNEARQEFDQLGGQTDPIMQDWSLWFRSDQVEPPILMLLGREEQARQRAREIVAACTEQFARGNRSPLVLTDYIRSEIVLGHRESALKALEEWRAEAQRETSTQRRLQEFTSVASRLYALLGEVDEAVELLRELQTNGYIGRYGLGDNPDYASLRGDPRFQEIVRQYEAWAKTLPDPMDL